MTTSSWNEVLQHLRGTVLLREGAELTDGQLLDCFVTAHETAALEVLVRRHGPMVWGVCRRTLGNVHDAEDAFQATFLVLVRKAASVSPRAKVGNWLYGVAYQTARKARALRAKRWGRERSGSALPEVATADDPLPSDLQPLLDQELSRLPEHYRTVLVLCALEGKSGREAAQQLGIPEGTVASRLARARALLAKRLARHGLSVSAGAWAAWEVQNGATAAMPAALVASIMNAVRGQPLGPAATTGVVSLPVAALTEGVLRSMFLTKLKTLGTIVLLASLAAIPATGLAVRALSMEGPHEKPRPEVSSELPLNEGEALDRDVGRLKVEVERLRTENAELKKRLQQQVRKGKASDAKLVISVYAVADLTSPAVPEETEAQPLMRVITRTVEPTSWYELGGEGSIEYLQAAGSLVVRQSEAVQEQVQELLNALRKTRTEQGRLGM